MFWWPSITIFVRGIFIGFLEKYRSSYFPNILKFYFDLIIPRREFWISEGRQMVG